MDIDELNPFRLDVDEAMAAARSEAIDTWRRIEADLRKNGPFSALLIQFRTEATEAMSALVWADARDPVAIAMHQAAVIRCLDTMEKVDAFRNAAEAADANTEAATALSDEDDQMLVAPDND